CRPTRKIQNVITKRDSVVVVAPPEKKGEDTAKIIKENFARLQTQKISFTTFSARMDVDYVGADGKKDKVNATLRMYKDSLIWISLTGLLGIEGLRAYITQDSIKVLNKLDKIYTARSVAYVQEVTGLPLDLSSMQDLIIGNPIFLDSNIVSFLRAGNTISILSIGEWFKNLITLNDGIMHHSKLDDLDINRNRTCDLTYDDYENKKGVSFSSKRRITVSEKSKLDIKLDFKSYNFNEPLNFRFSVPRDYKWN
ncbi:MAG TPA: DUF4292 domain-containing protein, partial [Chitinophagaceae bacterium]|nr:DUF4292 domain-containing protein [Chitinophagaceae bacterium]